MRCEKHAEDDFVTSLRWMRENVSVALRTRSELLSASGDWLLNSTIGLLVGVYSEALGKILNQGTVCSSVRFHAFAQKHLFAVLRPSAKVDGLWSFLHLPDEGPFASDAQLGAFVFWSIYRNGFVHAFAPSTKQVVEFGWGRYEEDEAWVPRKDQRCCANPDCCVLDTDVIDLNVQYVGREFVKASQAQEEEWRRQVANSPTSWRDLLDALHRES